MWHLRRIGHEKDSFHLALTVLACLPWEKPATAPWGLWAKVCWGGCDLPSTAGTKLPACGWAARKGKPPFPVKPFSDARQHLEATSWETLICQVGLPSLPDPQKSWKIRNSYCCLKPQCLRRICYTVLDNKYSHWPWLPLTLGRSKAWDEQGSEEVGYRIWEEKGWWRGGRGREGRKGEKQPLHLLQPSLISSVSEFLSLPLSHHQDSCLLKTGTELYFFYVSQIAWQCPAQGKTRPVSKTGKPIMSQLRRNFWKEFSKEAVVWQHEASDRGSAVDSVLCTVVAEQVLRDGHILLLLMPLSWHLTNHASQYFYLWVAPYHNVSEFGHGITFVQ